MATAGKIASSVFKTGPDDKLITTDVYSESPSTTQLTQVVDNSASVTGELAKSGQWLGSSDGMLSVIKSLSIGTNGKVSLDAKALGKRLLDASGGSASPFLAMVDSTKSRILSTLGLPPDTALNSNTLKDPKNFAGQALRAKFGDNVVFKNVSTLVDTADKIHSAKDVVSLLNSVVKDGELAQYLDMAPRFAILGDILTEASRWGIPDVIDTILADLPDATAKDKVLIDALWGFVQNSDLDGILRVISECGKDKVLARMPNLNSQLLKIYRFRDNSVAIPHGTLTGKLLSILNGLDSNWATYPRGSGSVSNLAVYTEASVDALTLLKNTDTHRLAAMIAPTYRTINLLDGLKRQYPNAGLL